MRFLRKNKLDIVICLILFLLSISLYTINLDRLPENCAPLTAGTSDYLFFDYLQKSNLKEPFQNYIQNIPHLSEFDKWHAANYLVAANPFQGLISALFIAIFGVKKVTIQLGGIFIGALTGIVTYLLAKNMFNRKVGLISALLLINSLWVITIVRLGYTHQIIPYFMACLIVYYFYRAPTLESRKSFWLVGTLLAIGLFNGYPNIYLLFPILLLWTIWNRENLLTLRKSHLWLTILILSGLFLFISVSYSQLIFRNPFYNLQSLYRWYFKDLLATRGGGSINLQHFKIVFKNLFIKMDLSTARAPEYRVVGKPMVAPFVSILFFIEVWIALKRRKPADKLLLLWVALPYITVSTVWEFGERYFFLAAPAVYILAGRGLWEIIEVFRKEKYKQNKILCFLSHKRKFVMSLIWIAFVLTILFSYKDYFIDYARMDRDYWRLVGSREIATYIIQRAPPDQCQIILGKQLFIPDEHLPFYFRIKGLIYRPLRWQEIIKDNKENIPEIILWEKSVFQKGKKLIVFVFSLESEKTKPYARPVGFVPSDGYDDLSLFLKIHPQLQPEKMIYYTDGQPAFAVYVLSEPPEIEYRYPVGIPGKISGVQTFTPEYPALLDKIKFLIGYRGEKAFLPDLTVELRKMPRDYSVTDIASSIVLASVTLSPSELNLKATQYSTIDLQDINLGPETTYAIIWKPLRIDEKNHYLLAGQDYDIYGEGQFGYHDGSQWRMLDADVYFVSLSANYTIESTVSKGIRAFRIPRESTSGRMSFKIVFKEKEWQKEIFDQKNLRYEEGSNGQFRWLTPEDESGGYLIYKVESPYFIKSMEFISNPRIHNDWEKKNSLRFSYSIDGKKYYEIYRLNSNGRDTWTGIYEREMDNTIHPKSKIVYLRFDFKRGNTQLWATDAHPIIFTINQD